MKLCKCGTEIRDDQKQCYGCFKSSQNLKSVARDEIILDCDDRKNGDMILEQISQLIAIDGYRLEMWKAAGQKSYHVYIRNIPHIAELPAEQNKLYKELLIKKYQFKLREMLGCEPEGLSKIDFSLCVPDHLVAAENKPHFKYKTEKKLIAVINPNCKNFCEKDIYEEVTSQDVLNYKPQVTGTGITAKIIQKISIIDIARQFGLDVHGNKTLCPFHPDNKTPSLVFYEQQGRFCCFGCQAKGNIIKFYAMLKGIRLDFVYHKPKEQVI